MRDNQAVHYNLTESAEDVNNLNDGLSRRATAQYTADMLLELRNLAKASGHKTLQGILEIAYYEAYSVANRVEPPPGEVEYLEQLSRQAAGSAAT
jgi:hypothetical protein